MHSIKFTVNLRAAVGRVEAFVLLKTIVVAVPDALANALSFELVTPVAPLTRADNYTFLLYILISKRWMTILDKNDFAIELLFVEGKLRTNDGLE